MWGFKPRPQPDWAQQMEGYRELSETLSELNTSQDDEWHIENDG